MEKIALIDLGSNTARLVIYDVLEGGHFVVTHEKRELVRLGEVEADGNLKQTRIMQAIATLKQFKQVCALHGVDRIIAIATAAVRHANNQKTFLSDVFNATGIRFSIVSEEEEARYVYQGVINSMDIPRGIIMEIGGGSTKFIYYNRRVILNTKILDFGAVTLTNMFANTDLTPEQRSNAIEQYVLEQLRQVEWFSEIDQDAQFIGVGGSFRNLARIIRKVKKYPLDMVHNYNMDKDGFDYVYNMIKTLETDKIRKIRGLSSTRVDVFPAALAIIKAFVDYMGATNIVSSGNGLREGVMFNHCVPQTHEKPISDVLGHRIRGILKHLEVDEAHAEQSFNLCVQLFKQLRVLHKFPRMYVKVLRIASLMHDCGRQFKYYNHYKHTAYMILNSNLYGVSHRDIVLASLVTDQYNKEDNSYVDWSRFNVILSPEDVEAVKKLSVILQLAVALDASGKKVVTELSCDVLGDSVIMKTELNGDASLELKSANDLMFDFKKVFKKNLEIL